MIDDLKSKLNDPLGVIQESPRKSRLLVDFVDLLAGVEEVREAVLILATKDGSKQIVQGHPLAILGTIDITKHILMNRYTAGNATSVIDGYSDDPDEEEGQDG